MNVNVKYKDKKIVEGALVADSFWPKLTGYMFRKYPHVPGIIFEPCNSIQTTFMRFDLDLVFLDRENRVVKIIRKMKPWRFTLFYLRAKKTLELPVGNLPAELQTGDILEVTIV
jgi:uncharacterized membrane protein (UPF0127 family)